MRPASAAPEQFSTIGAFTTAIDAWALGVALFELRYGRHPFWTDPPPTPEAVAAAILTSDVRFPTDSDDVGERLLQPWLRRLLERADEKPCLSREKGVGKGERSRPLAASASQPLIGSHRGRSVTTPIRSVFRSPVMPGKASELILNLAPRAAIDPTSR